MKSWRYVEEFRAVQPGEWFRILPVGEFRRFGREAVIRPDDIQEMAGHFGVIPDTKLPVNKEHVDWEGRVGTIAAVDARPDGLYAQIDWTEKGRRHLEDEDFQYFSPEIWWRTDYNDQVVKNVLVGLALTNSPYFGAETALFSLKDMGAATPPGAHGEVDSDSNHHEEVSMADTDKTTVKDAVRELFGELFGASKPEPQPAPEKVAFKVEETEEYKLMQARAEAAEQAKAEAERKQQYAARVEAFRAIVGDEFQVGEHKGADLFAAIAETHPDEAQALAEQVKALRAQVDEGELFGEFGTSTPEDTADPVAKFNALVEKRTVEGEDEADAIEAVGREHPDLYRAYIQA